MKLESIKGDQPATGSAATPGRCRNGVERLVANARGSEIVGPVLVDDAHRTHKDLPRTVALALRTKRRKHLLVRRVLIGFPEDKRSMPLVWESEVETGNHLNTGSDVRSGIKAKVLSAEKPTP